MSYYIFRIDYGQSYDDLKSEILKGKLRQGWGMDGMDVREKGAREKFIAQWGDNAGKRRYNIINIMTEMRRGDIIIVPKLNTERPVGDWNMKEYKEDWNKFFAILRCTAEYTFDEMKFDDGRTDYGHIIGVEPIVSFSYGHDDSSRVVSNFGGYWSAINRVYKEEFINAVNSLIQEFESDSTSPNHDDKSSLNSLSIDKNVLSTRNEYLRAIIATINGWTPFRLEEVIEELFFKNGYTSTSKHFYNRKGGDNDRKFILTASTMLMNDIVALANPINGIAAFTDESMPEIRVQAKNKIGKDLSDKEGVEQLVKMEGYESAINILINTTYEFSEETKKYADEQGVILVNGPDFASLLVKYGFDI